jgi:stress response protein YsnF
MAESNEREDVVVPVVHEEMHAEALPVETGGVRVTKRVEGHDEILEQELRKGRAEVKRVRTDRVVDGPQAVQRRGDTVIIPVVSEVLRVEKQWVVTEEIHVTQIEERQKAQETVTLNEEVARVERIDESGNVVSPIVDTANDRLSGGLKPRPSARAAHAAAGKAGNQRSSARKVLSDSESMIRDKR